MRIGQLARLTGKSVPALRYYEQVGLLAAPERTERGYREYAPETVERVRFIVRAQEQGFSLAEIAAILTLSDKGEAPCASVASAIRRKVRRLEARIAQLQERRAALSATLCRWQQSDSGSGAAASAAPFCSLLNVSPQDQRRPITMARKVEVFTAGCPLCEPVVKMVEQVACGNCDVTVYNLKDDAQAAERAKAAGVSRVPMVLVDGTPAACCVSDGPVTEAGLRAAGVGAG